MNANSYGVYNSRVAVVLVVVRGVQRWGGKRRKKGIGKCMCHRPGKGLVIAITLNVTVAVKRTSGILE